MKTNNLLLLAGAGAALLLLKRKKKETTKAPIYDNPEDANRDYYAEWLAEKENGWTNLEYEVWLGQIFPTGAYGIGRINPDRDGTRVIFRTFKNGIDKGEVIALFPDSDWDGYGRYVASYMHVGQHSGADYIGMMMETRPSTVAEYTPLLRELKSIGYDDLIISKRR